MFLFWVNGAFISSYIKKKYVRSHLSLSIRAFQYASSGAVTTASNSVCCSNISSPRQRTDQVKQAKLTLIIRFPFCPFPKTVNQHKSLKRSWYEASVNTNVWSSKPTLEVGLLPQQVADGGLKLRVLSVGGVDVRLTVSPEEKRFVSAGRTATQNPVCNKFWADSQSFKEKNTKYFHSDFRDKEKSWIMQILTSSLHSCLKSSLIPSLESDSTNRSITRPPKQIVWFLKEAAWGKT